MFEQQIDRILQKAEAIDLELVPTIAEDKLLALEERYALRLPDSYRAYLTRIQNGGASSQLDHCGPYYGIYPIEKSLEEADEWGVTLTNAFPLAEDLEFGELYNADPDWDRHVSRCQNDPEYLRAIEAVLAEHQTLDMIAGSIPVCQYGCGDFFRLVVNGEDLGGIWVDSGIMNDTGFFAMNVDILTFFESWLDRKILVKEGKSQRLINACYAFLEFGDNKRYQVL